MRAPRKGKPIWKWPLRIAIAILAMAAGLITLDFARPSITATAAYGVAIRMWKSNAPPKHDRVSIWLMHFAGLRHYAPAQMAMSQAYDNGDGVPRARPRSAIWLRGAEAGGYLPTIYRRTWYMSSRGESLSEKVDRELDIIKEFPHLRGRNDRTRADIERRHKLWRFIHALAAHFAVDAGDPFALLAVKDWWMGLSDDEQRNVWRRYQELKAQEIEPLPPSDFTCQHLLHVIVGPSVVYDPKGALEAALSCLEHYRRHPWTLTQWRTFLSCAEAWLPRKAHKLEDADIREIILDCDGKSSDEPV